MKKILFFLLLLFTKQISAQCNYVWAQWTSHGMNDTAMATLSVNGAPLGMTMTANYLFDFTPTIFNYSVFSAYPTLPPNSAVPRTTWAAGAGGITKMCFSQAVVNPVLFLASIGSVAIPVTLSFSTPYNVVFDAGGNTFTNPTTIDGAEGNCIIEFPGTFTCVTIFSTTLEFYTNISWGVKNPLTAGFTYANQCLNNTVDFSSAATTINAPGTIIAYHWDFGDGTTDTSQNPTHIYPDTGTYNVQLVATSNSFCNDTFTTAVTVFPSYSVNNPVSICGGQTYTINSHTYSTAGTYYDTLNASLGCDSIIVTQLSVGQTAGSVNLQSICSGGSYSFNAHLYTTAGSYNDTLVSVSGCDSVVTTQLTVTNAFQSNNPQSICTGGSYTFNSHTYSATGVYDDTLHTAAGCDSVVTTQLTVSGSIQANNPRSICPGGSYTFNSHTYNSTGVYYDTLQTATGCDSIVTTTLTLNPLPSITFNHPADICISTPAFALTYALPTGGTYNGTGVLNNTFDPQSANIGMHLLTYSFVDSATTCMNIAQENISVRPAPVAQLSVTPKNVHLSDPRITFIDLTAGSSHSQWDFGDNSTSADQNGFHTYTDTGQFQVTLIVTDSLGCYATAYETIFIDGEFAFYLPNTFTPNGDGINDYFSGLGVGVNDYIMKIFNRWGKEIFETTDLALPWNGKDVPGDTYVYKINLSDVFGVDHEFVGKVSVVR